MLIRVTRRVLREQADGTAVLEVHVPDPADVVAVLRMGPIGAPLCLSLDAPAPHDKPPPITVAAHGVAAGHVGAAQAPAAVADLRRLAGDPLFQLYATETTGADPGTVQDALAFAIRFAVIQSGAREPADFEDPDVLDRFAGLRCAFDVWRKERER